MALYTTQILIAAGQMSVGGEPGYIFSDGWLGPKDLGLVGWWATPNATKSDQSVQVKFSGIHIVIFGGGYTFKWSIDGSTPQTTTPVSIAYGRIDNYMFNSSILEDGNHTLIMSDFTGNTSVYEALVRPGPSTPLNLNTRIEVDDADPSITYQGQWVQKVPTQRLSNHNSVNPGDSVSFGFCGSYIAVIGSFFPVYSGSFTIGVALDGRTPETRTYSSETRSGSQFFKLYDSQLNGDCQHHVVVSVLDIKADQSFSFESFRYTPSFPTFGELPSGTALPEPSGTSQTPSTTDSGNASGSSHKSSSVIGPAVGGAIGGVVLIAGIILALFFLRRRGKEKATKPSAVPAQGAVKGFNQGGFTAVPEIQTEAHYSPYHQHSSGIYNPPAPGVRRVQPPLFTPSPHDLNINNLSYVPPTLASSPRDFNNNNVSYMPPALTPSTHDLHANNLSHMSPQVKPPPHDADTKDLPYVPPELKPSSHDLNTKDLSYVPPEPK